MKRIFEFAYVYLVLAPLFWAGNFIFGKFLNTDIPPFTFAFYRWLLVVIILLPFVYKEFIRHKKYIFSNIISIIILSFLSIFIYTSFLYLGLHSTTVVSAGALNALVPIFIMLISWFSKREKFTLTKFFATVVAFFGAILIITHGKPIDTFINFQFNKGDVIILTSVLSWAAFSVLLNIFKIKLPPFLFLFITAIFGDLLLFPAYLYEHISYHNTHFNLEIISGIIYASVFSSIFAFTFWNRGVLKIGAASASYFFNLLPVFGAILAVIFLREKINYYDIIGFSLVLFGICISKMQINKK